MPDWINTRWQQNSQVAVINTGDLGDNQIVAAAPRHKIRVYAAALIARGTTLARFESGAGGTALTGQKSMGANTGFVLDWNPDGWFETNEGESLNLELSAAVNVDGELRYRLIPQD